MKRYVVKAASQSRRAEHQCDSLEEAKQCCLTFKKLKYDLTAIFDYEEKKAWIEE